jgi:hypothetical protein
VLPGDTPKNNLNRAPSYRQVRTVQSRSQTRRTGLFCEVSDFEGKDETVMTSTHISGNAGRLSGRCNTCLKFTRWSLES